MSDVKTEKATKEPTLEEREPLDMDTEAAETDKLNPTADTSGGPSIVKFTDNKNGEAVVEVGDTRLARSVGMNKKELMKYANDPFWVRLRMSLFVLFWIVWVAMLVVSGVIVYLTPKCHKPIEE